METQSFNLPNVLGTEEVETNHFLDNFKFFARTKAKNEAFVFLSTENDREAITWSELYQKSQDVAHALVDIGVKHGEIVAVSIRSCLEWLFVAFGSMLMGAVPINLVFTYKDGSDVLALMKKLEKCSFLALDPGSNDGNWEIFKKLIDVVSADGTVSSSKMPYLRYLIGHHPDKTIPGVKMFRDWMKESHPKCELPPIDPNRTAFLFQTSGSTGVPKVVPHSFKFFEHSILVHDNRTQYNDRPFGWIGGFPFSLVDGSKRVTLSGFCEPPSDKVGFLIDAVRCEAVQVISMLPPAIAELLSRKSMIKGTDWHLQTITTGGQPLTSHLMQVIGEVCEEVRVAYGATEFGAVCISLINTASMYKDMCCGVPLADIEVKIADKEGIEVPVNTTGEVYVRGKWGFEGYLNDPEKSKHAVTYDGWFKTGDMGKVNEKAELFVMGRISNEIIRGGMNISPEILEAVLKTCPLVEHAMIVPIPDEFLYQEICACVTLKKGISATASDIQQYCEDLHADPERVFSYLPAYYLIFERFPETTTGKHARKEVANEAIEMIKERKRLN